MDAWDFREAEGKRSTMRAMISTTPSCLAWSPREDHLIAVGCGEGMMGARVEILDSRKMGVVRSLIHEPTVTSSSSSSSSSSAVAPASAPSTTNNNEYGGVGQVRWHPERAGILASASADGGVRMWSVRAPFTSTNSSETGGNNDPALLFLHAGHTDLVSDFQFLPGGDDAILSVADDNISMCWRPLGAIAR